MTKKADYEAWAKARLATNIRRRDIVLHPAPTRISIPVSAQYPGRCDRCWRDFRQGTIICLGRFWDGEQSWVHVECTEVPEGDREQPSTPSPLRSFDPEDLPSRDRLAELAKGVADYGSREARR